MTWVCRVTSTSEKLHVSVLGGSEPNGKWDYSGNMHVEVGGSLT